LSFASRRAHKSMAPRGSCWKASGASSSTGSTACCASTFR
jgi:hypothetical protein